MNKKHRRTLEAIFAEPVRSNIAWRDIESMFVAVGAVVEERAGSRIGVLLNDMVAIFHRPHPEKETDKGAVKSVRSFLVAANIVTIDNAGNFAFVEED
ncbi:type II toxin-antitoxin system HicA family toxin [Bremerella cremea]|nr:type II toxin-antitoxin system HicA family toxin [Bremerella cremea]